MDVKEKILEVAYQLMKERPIDQIRFSDIAERADVHWTTVRRHLGSKQELRALLADKQTECGQVNLDTKTRVLDAAERVFAQKGYAGTTLDEVAADAGLSKGAVYWHFASKSDLYLALCERSLSQQLRTLPAEIEKILQTNDPMPAISLWLQSRLELTPEKSKLFFEFVTSSRDPEIRRKLSEWHGSMLLHISEVVERLQSQGLVTREIDAKHFANIWNALMNGLMMNRMIDRNLESFDETLNQASRILWKGLQP